MLNYTQNKSNTHSDANLTFFYICSSTLLSYSRLSLLSYNTVIKLKVKAHFLIERITQWTHYRIRLILLHYVLNPQHYHWNAAASRLICLNCLSRMVVRWVAWLQRSTTDWTESSPTSNVYGRYAVIQLAEGWCSMTYELKWSFLKSNQRHLIRNQVNLPLQYKAL